MKILLSVSLLAVVQLVGVKPAAADDVCESAAFQKQCKQAHDYYMKYCGSPRSLDAYTPESDANDAWIEDAKQIGEIVSVWKQVAEKYPTCYSGHGSCRLSKYERDTCIAMPATYKSAFEEYVSTIKGSVVDGWKRDIARAHKNPLDPFATRVFGSARKVINRMREVSSLAFLAVDPKEIDEIDGWLAKEEAQWQAERAKTLLKVKCPHPRYKNKRLTKLLYKVLVAQGEATKKPGSTLKETIGEFGLSGKARQKREAFKHVLHEDIPAFSCVLQERGDQRTCRIFDITFRRSKPDGGTWGPWGFYSTGGGGEMSCKNLKGIK